MTLSFLTIAAADITMELPVPPVPETFWVLTLGLVAFALIILPGLYYLLALDSETDTRSKVIMGISIMLGLTLGMVLWVAEVHTRGVTPDDRRAYREYVEQVDRELVQHDVTLAVEDIGGRPHRPAREREYMDIIRPASGKQLRTPVSQVLPLWVGDDFHPAARLTLSQHPADEEIIRLKIVLP
ncbi:hypothetical protein [Nesterenkonia rhizosphaerae]|uniref:Uncharacterized protein n=1 Tax=Nesterenkonia rhizosphaerae TaxID=1348272 RepID=A0ABP9G3Z8_9MICC